MSNAKRPGFAGDIPVSALLAARRFTARKDVRPFLRPAWLLPEMRMLVACNGRALLRMTLAASGWRNPGEVDAVAVDVNRADVYKWLGAHRSTSVRLISWTGDAESRLRACGDRSDWIGTTCTSEYGYGPIDDPGPLGDGGYGLDPRDDGLPHDFAMSFSAPDVANLCKAADDLSTARNNAHLVFEPPSIREGGSGSITRVRIVRQTEVDAVTSAEALIMNAKM